MAKSRDLYAKVESATSNLTREQVAIEDAIAVVSRQLRIDARTLPAIQEEVLSDAQRTLRSLEKMPHVQPFQLSEKEDGADEDNRNLNALTKKALAHLNPETDASLNPETDASRKYWAYNHVTFLPEGDALDKNVERAAKLFVSETGNPSAFLNNKIIIASQFFLPDHRPFPHDYPTALATLTRLHQALEGIAGVSLHNEQTIVPQRGDLPEELAPRGTLVIDFDQCSDADIVKIGNALAQFPRKDTITGALETMEGRSAVVENLMAVCKQHGMTDDQIGADSFKTGMDRYKTQAEALLSQQQPAKKSWLRW